MEQARTRPTDSAVAIVVAAVLTLVVSADQGGVGGPAAYVWAAALGALMFWRRRYPRTVLALTVLGLFAYYAAGFPAIGVAVPVAAALYGAAEAGHRAVAVLAATTVLAVSVTFRLLEGQDFHYVVLYEGAGHAALMAAAITLGELVLARRRIEALTGQHIALEADRRLAEHKQDLSRDLHDSIGHTLTVAAIHTSVARQEAGRRPEAAAAALEHVSAAVSQALAELRTTVRRLRADPAPPDETPAEPAPSLVAVESLAGTARAAGFTVRTRVEAVEAPEVSTTAYRLVQEAVTNAMRHSDGRRIAIDVWRETGDLKVLVQDDGTSAGAAGESAGLTGMRERVLALGGQFDSGPASAGPAAAGPAARGPASAGPAAAGPAAPRPDAPRPASAAQQWSGWHVSASIPLGATDD